MALMKQFAMYMELGIFNWTFTRTQNFHNRPETRRAIAKKVIIATKKKTQKN